MGYNFIGSWLLAMVAAYLQFKTSGMLAVASGKTLWLPSSVIFFVILLHFTGVIIYASSLLRDNSRRPDYAKFLFFIDGCYVTIIAYIIAALWDISGTIRGV